MLVRSDKPIRSLTVHVDNCHLVPNATLIRMTVGNAEDAATEKDGGYALLISLFLSFLSIVLSTKHL